MKKFLMIGFLITYGHLTNAQNANELVAVNDTTVAGLKLSSLEEKLNKHEEQLQSLRKENDELKKQMKQLRPLLNADKKIIISRNGSKQLIVN
ncbi:MAG TPA: hypothetical protein VLJ41_02735 [Segetibacter sp.]|nr:hypothetical protein [Segetibacter sp.]